MLATLPIWSREVDGRLAKPLEEVLENGLKQSRQGKWDEQMSMPSVDLATYWGDVELHIYPQGRRRTTRPIKLAIKADTWTIKKIHSCLLWAPFLGDLVLY